MRLLWVGALAGNDRCRLGWQVRAAQALVGWIVGAVDAPVSLLPTRVASPWVLESHRRCAQLQEPLRCCGTSARLW